MLKRLTHTGSTLRPRPVADKAAIAAALEEKVWPLLAAGASSRSISRLPLAEAAAAHALMEVQRSHRQDRADDLIGTGKSLLFPGWIATHGSWVEIRFELRLSGPLSREAIV